VVGLSGWLLIFSAGAVWELIALFTRSPHLVTLSHMIEWVERPVGGRWALFGIWLVLGFYIFVPR
jgi:hypothetical protein